MPEDPKIDNPTGREVSPEIQSLFSDFITNASLYSLTGQNWGGGARFSDIATQKWRFSKDKVRDVQQEINPEKLFYRFTGKGMVNSARGDHDLEEVVRTYYEFNRRENTFKESIQAKFERLADSSEQFRVSEITNRGEGEVIIEFSSFDFFSVKIHREGFSVDFNYDNGQLSSFDETDSLGYPFGYVKVQELIRFAKPELIDVQDYQQDELSYDEANNAVRVKGLNTSGEVTKAILVPMQCDPQRLLSLFQGIYLTDPYNASPKDDEPFKIADLEGLIGIKPDKPNIPLGRII